MIICIVNRKGGCGKSSSVFHGSAAFAATGSKVLCVDLDPQASLSQGFFGPKWVESLPKARSITALFDKGYNPVPEQLIYPTPIQDVSVIPASNDLTPHNLSLPSPGGDALGRFLRKLKAEFPVILLDCPPNLQFCSWSALLASDYVLVPVISEDFSAQGLIHVRQTIVEAQSQGNSRLKLLGYLLTMFSKQLAVHRVYEKLLRQEYGPLVFERPMVLAAAFKEAVSRRTPVTLAAPKSVAAQAMKAIVAEIISRVGAPQHLSAGTQEHQHGQS